MLNAVVTVVVSLLAIIAAALILGALRWKRGTRALRARLVAARMPVTPQKVDFRELEGLPQPVQGFFRAVLSEGQPMVAGVQVQHSGRFRMGDAGDKWKPFTSNQQIVTRRPGFDWEGRIAMMPGLRVRVHDAYIAGEGLLHASLFGLMALARVSGTGALAEGELMRFLAEAAWYPTALLPSQGARWQAVDERSARATLTDGSIAVGLLFSFTEDGLIDTIGAEARGRMVEGDLVPTPWQGRFWNHGERGGMKIPLDGEVAWLIPGDTQPYWRGHIDEVTYDFSESPRS
jgi:hypothetical protein